MRVRSTTTGVVLSAYAESMSFAISRGMIESAAGSILVALESGSEADVGSTVSLPASGLSFACGPKVRSLVVVVALLSGVSTGVIKRGGNLCCKLDLVSAARNL